MKKQTACDQEKTTCVMVNNDGNGVSFQSGPAERALAKRQWWCWETPALLLQWAFAEGLTPEAFEWGTQCSQTHDRLCEGESRTQERMLLATQGAARVTQQIPHRGECVRFILFFNSNSNFQASKLTLGWSTPLPWSYGRALEVCCHKRETDHTTWWTGPRQEPTCHWVCLGMAAL